MVELKMVDYDLGRIVETAAWMEFRAEHLERARQLQLEERELNPSLTNGEARQEVLDTVVKAGIPEEYAKKALEQLYPPEEKLRRMENELGVSESDYVVERKNSVLVTNYFRDLSQSLDNLGSGLELGFLVPTALNAFLEQNKDTQSAIAYKLDSGKLGFDNWKFTIAGKENYFESLVICAAIYKPVLTEGLFGQRKIKREDLAYFGIEIMPSLFSSVKNFPHIEVKVLSPEPVEIIGETLRRHPKINFSVTKYYF